MFLNKNKRFRKDRLRGFCSRLKSQKITQIVAIRALETGYLTEEQLEAARKAIQRLTMRYKEIYSVFIRVLPLLSRSKKTKGIRMGAAKGSFYRYIYRAKAGMLLFEIHHVKGYQLLRRLRYIMAKLPIQVIFVILREKNAITESKESNTKAF